MLLWSHITKNRPAAFCASEIFTQRYCRCNIDKEIKLISVTLMWQQIIHGSIRSHFHSTTQRQRIPWSVAVNGSLYQPSWKACLITHSNTTVPRVLDFPNGHRFTDQRGTVRHMTCFSMCGAQMPSCCKCVKLFFSLFLIFNFCFYQKINFNQNFSMRASTFLMFSLILNSHRIKFVINSLKVAKHKIK